MVRMVAFAFVPDSLYNPDSVDVTRNQVAVEAIGKTQGPFKIDPLAGSCHSEGRAVERFGGHIGLEAFTGY